MAQINTNNLVNLATVNGQRIAFVAQDEAVRKAGAETFKDGKQFVRSAIKLGAEVKSAWDRASGMK